VQIVLGSNETSADRTTAGYCARRRMISFALGSTRRAVLIAVARSEGAGRTRSGAFLRSTEERRTWAYWR
jgi:hypothetical protein